MTTSATYEAELNKALQSFATGVTVITTRGGDGQPLGITATSFNAVSADPPTVLWSVPRSAARALSFEGATHWAAHILADDQEALARHFADGCSSDFSPFPTQAGSGGVPLLAGCATRLQCRTSFRYRGGDHLIFVGEVHDHERRSASPLLFHDGHYNLAMQRAERCATPAPRSEWSANNLGYLLGRAYFQLYAHIQPHAHRNGLSDAQYFALAVLIMRDGRSLDAINAVFAYSGVQTSSEEIQALCARGLLRTSGNGASAHYYLTERGRQLTLRIVAAAEGAERDALSGMSEADATALRQLLQRFVGQSPPASRTAQSAPAEPERTKALG